MYEYATWEDYPLIDYLCQEGLRRLVKASEHEQNQFLQTYLYPFRRVYVQLLWNHRRQILEPKMTPIFFSLNNI